MRPDLWPDPQHEPEPVAGGRAADSADGNHASASPTPSRSTVTPARSVRRFVAATVRGMEAAFADPAEAVQILGGMGYMRAIRQHERPARVEETAVGKVGRRRLQKSEGRLGERMNHSPAIGLAPEGG